MPEAAYIFQQMASGREYKVSGQPRAVARCVEWLNNATTQQYDGITMTGFDDFERRRAFDWLTIGRTLMYAPLEGDLEYLDPATTFFDYQNKRWYSTLTSQEYPAEDVQVSHAIPLGISGAFMSPLMPVVSTAMLAYLIREHDKASVDGRKIRDILIVQGKELAERALTAMNDMMNNYTEADPTKHRIPVIYYETGGTVSQAAQDIVGRIGLSEIPAGFNRPDFEFAYANQIAGATGLSLRHFWNSEKATNRALEEVQEARQAQKGPSYYVRTEQRIFNNRGVIPRRFGRSVRTTFIEEVDVQSRETNAKVLKLYAESVQLLNSLAPGQIDVAALIAFLQRDDILPADAEIFNPDAPPTQSVIKTPSQAPMPGEETAQQSSDPGASLQKSIDLDYGEVTMTLDGRIVERRNRVYNIEKALSDILEKDSEFIRSVQKEAEVVTSENFLEKAHAHNLELFQQIDPEILEQILSDKPVAQRERAKSFSPDSLTDDDHRLIASILMEFWTYED